MGRRPSHDWLVVTSLVLSGAGYVLAAPAEGDWQPPVGIPAPGFGLFENAGPYTHYVDNTAGNCSDATDGTAAEPRCSIPRDLSAGDVVEVHGGPYTYGNDPEFDATGTLAAPAFLRGVDDGAGLPVLDDGDTFVFTGSHFIIEELIFDHSRIRVRDGDRVVIRDCEITRHPSSNGAQLGGTHVMLFRSHVHHHQGDDRHGVFVASGSRDVWVLENDVHHNGGDGIQFCHNCTADPPARVFIGRNQFHSDRENGVDLKYGVDIVVSENRIWAYRSAPAGEEWCFDDGSYCGVFSSGSDGSAIVLGSDGAPENPWVLHNEIFDSAHGIRNEETYGAWIVGNVIHGVEGNAIGLEKNGQPLFIIGNTIHDAEYGINQFWRVNFELHVHNNIFSSLTAQPLNIESNEVAAATTLSHNLFWQDGPVSFRWVSQQTADTGAGIDTITGGTGNLVADPVFLAPGTNHLIPPGSPAVDAGDATLAALQATFDAIFGGGVSIQSDFTGATVPMDGDDDGTAEPDIGAYEVSGPGDDLAPAAPTGLVAE